jgi:hypothetical protein
VNERLSRENEELMRKIKMMEGRIRELNKEKKK